MANEKEGTGIKVTRSGKVKRANADTQLIVRTTAEVAERFKACVLLDATIHGGDVNYASTMRRMIVEYCNRIEAVASSPVARDGAKVLRKKAV